jgi:hypothetical protein
VCGVAAGNALELLLHRGVLVAEGNPLRGDTRFRKGPSFEALAPLRARLAAARDTR